MTNFEKCLRDFNKQPIHIIGGVNSQFDYVSLDLSINNDELNRFDITNPKILETYIASVVRKGNKKVAYGGYNEVRNIYSRSTHFYRESKLDERNIHLGLDLWCNAGTPVLAALNGTVHSFKNNTAFGDYGPTVILEHQIEGVIFYALYGHLSLASLETIQLGGIVAKGDVVGYLGDASVNGDYPPHLHYQLIQDLERAYGDYKGVTSINNRVKDLVNCPDPNLLLKIY